LVYENKEKLGYGKEIINFSIIFANLDWGIV